MGKVSKMKGGIFIKNIMMMTSAYIAMVTTNALANILPINGQTTADVSNKQDVLFTPAGYVFSIWGLIYFLLAVWLFLQFTNRNTEHAPTERISMLFTISCFVNMAWLLSWHYELFALSVGLMLVLLLLLIVIYVQYPKTDARFGGRFPFSFYLGWISVATIANISYTLKYYDVSLGVSEITGTIILLLVAAVLAISGRYLSQDPYFAIVFVWAIVGIAARNTEQVLVVSAYIIAAVIFIAIIAVSFINRQKTNVAQQ